MRFIYLFSAMGLSLSAPVHAQSAAVDPFSIVRAIDSSQKVEAVSSPANNPDYQLINLGPAGSDRALKQRQRLENALVKALGRPQPSRAQTMVWDVPVVNEPDRMTTVMFYVNQAGDQILKLDRRTGERTAPAAKRASEIVPKDKPPAQSAGPISASSRPALSIWDGQPD